MNRVGRYRKLSGVRAFSDKMMNAFAFAVQQPVYCGQVSRRDRSCATNDLDFDEATRLSLAGIQAGAQRKCWRSRISTEADQHQSAESEKALRARVPLHSHSRANLRV
jgi:hypothetical protein